MEQQAHLIQKQFNEPNQLKSKELATKLDIKDVELKIVQTKNQIVLWVVSIMTGYSVFFLGILAKGFHWF